jgi:hypothetical protein
VAFKERASEFDGPIDGLDVVESGDTPWVRYSGMSLYDRIGSPDISP